jgi:hypothetical protein
MLSLWFRAKPSVSHKFLKFHRLKHRLVSNNILEGKVLWSSFMKQATGRKTTHGNTFHMFIKQFQSHFKSTDSPRCIINKLLLTLQYRNHNFLYSNCKLLNDKLKWLYYEVLWAVGSPYDIAHTHIIRNTGLFFLFLKQKYKHCFNLICFIISTSEDSTLGLWPKHYQYLLFTPFKSLSSLLFSVLYSSIQSIQSQVWHWTHQA